MTTVKYTPFQQEAINYRGKKLLVSASAGTGKTTVMIERILSMLLQGADLSQFVVVTFTNLAASEMKNRLATKLAQYRNNEHIAQQLDKLDGAHICTLHSFCSDLLRNYFYLVDVDPAFTILDSKVVATLRKNAMNEVFRQYFAQDDDVFLQTYRIFAKSRNEDNFKSVLFDLYDFSCCLEDFSTWYANARNNFTQYSPSNPLVQTLQQHVKRNVQHFAQSYYDIANRCLQCGCIFDEMCQENAQLFGSVDTTSLQNALQQLYYVEVQSPPRRNSNKSFGCDKYVEEQIRQDIKDLQDNVTAFLLEYNKLCRGKTLDQLWKEGEQSVVYTDKLVEIVNRFSQEYFAQKKSRGGLDFNDLEQLTLQLLGNDEALHSIAGRFANVFVDEYQDTNYVQEAIISKLSSCSNLFMVGDVKQSIYGFRGCEPSIFSSKYKSFKADDNCGHLVELNDNYRSNSQILNFVNFVFGDCMTEAFGKVDYKNTANLTGSTPALLGQSVVVDLVVKPSKQKQRVQGLYDVTAPTEQQDQLLQAQLVANNVKKMVGMAYRDDKGNTRRIAYQDIVILMRGLTAKSTEIYNALVQNNIPVVASIKVEGYANKEVRDIVNLLRMVDNPYNDVYTVGVCLSCFGKLTQAELGIVRLETEGRVPFYDRLISYGNNHDDQISAKINAVLDFVRQVRFYSRSAVVCDVVLKVMELTNYPLYVEALPNGALRLRKLYAFVDSIKGATYCQSIDKFLSYIDEIDEKVPDETPSDANAVRLMTMHASKGLEFPIVIVAGTETSFRFDNDSVQRNTNIGLATYHYNFDNMRYAETLGYRACVLSNKTKQKEEEMRLLYVALTRAKLLLNVVGTVTQTQLTALPKLPIDATCHLDWLLFSLDKRHQGALPQGTTVNVLYNLEMEEQNHFAPVLCQQDKNVKDVLQTLNYRYPYASQVDMPTKVVSSQLDKDYLQVEPTTAPTLNDQQAFSNQVGTAYHKMLQYAPLGCDYAKLQQVLEWLVAEGKVTAEVASQVQLKVVFDALHNDQLQQLCKLGNVYHEIPFMLNVPYNQVAKDKDFTDTVMLQGVIDLLVLGKDSAVVVDFKYTSHTQRIKQNYQAQLDSYRLAVSQICNVTKVDCYVLSLADNTLVKL